MTRGIIITAPASGSGKSVVTMALLRALLHRKQRVAAFKTGPDYIDGAFHAVAGCLRCRSLDPWCMSRSRLHHEYARLSDGADIVVGEGTMGLFDSSLDGTGSTADLATVLGLPCVLVVNTRGLGASVAALVEGFHHHRKQVSIAGVILNQVSSARHLKILELAMNGVAPVFGHLSNLPEFRLPHRHLGLVQAIEHEDLEVWLEHAATRVAETLDLDALISVAREAGTTVGNAVMEPVLPLGQRISIAHDSAFAFCYPTIVDDWRDAGAEITWFSPLADEGPHPEADAVYLPGGYPELHAATLSSNRRFHDSLREAASQGAFVYGECGGYMALGDTLIDADGNGHPMAGLLPICTSFAKPRRHLGYRQLKLETTCQLGTSGTALRGHEFHYATLETPSGPHLFSCKAADGSDLPDAGTVVGNVAGSFCHVVDRYAPEC